MRSNSSVWLSTLLLAGYAVLLPSTAEAAATITIVNVDGPGEGFNDPTPAAPVGGNAGVTLGAQRLIAFQHAANIWGATLTSAVTIEVEANFDPLSCNATGAVLGAAGPQLVWRDFPGAPLAGHWYHSALANKIFGADLSPAPTDYEIGATFNANLGQVGCLTGTFFYLGLDSNHGANIDLVTVVLHELGHGLGFSTTTSSTTGAFLAGFPSAFDNFLRDNTTSKFWNLMTDPERLASAINTGKLAWTGAIVTGSTAVVLQGNPQMVVSAPANVAGTYLVGTAGFGPALTVGGVTGGLMPISDLGCNPFSPLNAAAVNGNIALIDRGTCGFVVKVKNAQNAGAKAVVIADNVAGSPPPGLGGSDPTITIPAVRITQADGNALKAQLRFRARTRSGVVTKLNVNTAILAGADAAGRALMYTPNPVQPGSSVSHWDTSATPNQLMEPSINGNLTHSVVPPQDLTKQLLLDLGW
ncbi:MAG: peptidase [Bryobacterales bacterium]|nr:peptidase [Bryobacterales bacterium]